MRTAFLLGAMVAFGQTSQTFEVASVKPSVPGWERGGVYFGPPRGGPGTPDPGQITWTYARFRDLLMTAYDLKTYQIVGPAWMDTERYDIAVKVPAGATKDQLNVMWQNLLAERFGVKIHHDPKDFQVEDLVIGKGGSKLKETTEDTSGLPPPGPPKFKDGVLSSPGLVTTIAMNANRGSARAVAKAQPLSKLVAMMSAQQNHPVIDKTGLSGLYDFSLEFTLVLPLPPGAPPDTPAASDPGPDLAAAVERELGLKLVGSKAKLDVIVIDQAEKVPTEN